MPSLHGSIYEAYHVSNTNSEETANDSNLESWLTATVHGLSRAPPKVGHTIQDVIPIEAHPGVENKLPLLPPSETFAVDDINFRYGKGTMLSTITEKKSTGTMVTIDLKASSLPSKNPRRKKSFSTGDVPPIGVSYQEVLAMIENQTKPIKEIYAEPKSPLTGPPIRASTPPGVPSWDQHQRSGTHNIRAQASRPNLLQRLFAGPPSIQLVSSRNATESTPRTDPAMSRFRPPRSAYGPMSQHPFHRAPVEKPSAVSNHALCTASIAPPIGSGTRQINYRTPDRSRLVEISKSSQTLTPTPVAAPLTDSITVRTNIDISTAYQPTPPLSHLAYIPPPSYTLPKQKPCTHKFGRKGTFKAPDPPPPSRCSQYERLVQDRPPLEPLSHPCRSRSPSRQSSQDALPNLRAFENLDSISSTTHLMSIALSPRHPPSPTFGCK